MTTRLSILSLALLCGCASKPSSPMTIPAKSPVAVSAPISAPLPPDISSIMPPGVSVVMSRSSAAKPAIVLPPPQPLFELLTWTPNYDLVTYPNEVTVVQGTFDFVNWTIDFEGQTNQWDAPMTNGYRFWRIFNWPTNV